MDAKIAGFYTYYDAYFCKIFTYLCKSSLERRFMKKIMNEKLTITTSNPVRARFYVRGEKRCVSKFGRSENI